MKLKFCGGANEVGASCILVQVQNKNILLDCGMRMSSDPIPDLDIIKKSGGLDLIVISHAHMDHIGTLPIISTEYPNAKIIMTHMSKDLTRVLLYDSLKIMDLKEAEIPIFSEIHVRNMLDRIICYSPEFDIHPFNDDIKITMFSAGHIPGAVFVYITSKDGSIFYSGDFSITPQLAVGGGAVPKLRPDVGIFESTYGNRLHVNRDTELNSLLDKIIEVVSSKNKILIPAFALGRAQEIILFLNNSINKGTCPEFKIYVDGMVNDICRVFRNNPNYLKERYAKKIFKGTDIFYNDFVVPVPRNEKARRDILTKEEGACIISSSGMLTGGPSTFYAKYLASNENSFIALTGYQDEESPGARLIELADAEEDEDKKIKLGDEIIPLKCKIGMYRLSAHADKSQILALAHSLSPNHTFFVHGSMDSVNEISSSFQREHIAKTYVPQNGEEFAFELKKIKRKQIEKGPLKSMNMYFDSINDIIEDDFKALWEFISKNYPINKGFTLEDLIFILTGTYYSDGLKEFNKKLYESRYFSFEIKRPHIFHYVNAEELVVKEDFMEINKAFSLVQELFTPFGLYKKGARHEEKTILLSFNFPIIAKKKIQDKVDEFEENTKWKIEVNNECSREACEFLIESLIPPDFYMVKSPSYYRTENLFRVTLNKLPKKYKDLEKDFYEKTGMILNLSVPTDPSTSNENIAIKKIPGQVEQNVAFSSIETAFSNYPDKIFKKSIKIQNGEQYIELNFISPKIGHKYHNLIEKLQIQLRWNIVVGNSVNQNEIFKIAKSILFKNNLLVKKVSYLPDKNAVKVTLLEMPNDEVKDSMAQEFLSLTGLDLEF